MSLAHHSDTVRGNRVSRKKAGDPPPVIEREDFAVFMRQLDAGSIDLVLTDPPYTISRKTGFSNVGPNGVQRFAVSMDFGKWDKVQIDLDKLATGMHRVLRQGGTAVVFYDIWKITHLADAMTEAGFKMLRVIQWQKTNPVPLNSKATYLSNSREIAVVGVKGGKPTFKGEYHNGVFEYPIPRHKGKRVHPTQKPLDLFTELVELHAKPGDIVLDPFLGSGTTAVAALRNDCLFVGCDKDAAYVKAARARLKNET